LRDEQDRREVIYAKNLPRNSPGKLLKGNCGRSTAADEVISEKGPEAMADGPSRARQVSNLAISNSIIERPINGRPCFGSALHR